MITEKQKQFILNNKDELDKSLREMIDKIIDNMSKEYATEIISNIIEKLQDIGYESLDYGDR